MAKTKESAALEACTRVTLLGNKISVHMLEYLSTVKSHPEGFEQLTREFLDICRILFSIEAGLGDSATMGRRFPSDMVIELERKFRTTQSDFTELDRMIHKFLEYENKGTMGRIQKGFRRMFPDQDIPRMRESLARSREALRMSALVFQWSLGDARIEDSVGIGYTGLAAALDRIHGGRSVLTRNENQSSSVINNVTNVGGTNSSSNNNSNSNNHNSSAANNNNSNNNASSAPPAPAKAVVNNNIPTVNANGTISRGPKALPPSDSSSSLARSRTVEQQSDNNGITAQQAIKSSMLDVGVNNSNSAVAGNGSAAGSYATRSSSMMHHSHPGSRSAQSPTLAQQQDDMPPMLPTPQFLTERDSGKEINLSDELKLIPELRRRPSTSNDTVASSLRDAAGIIPPRDTITSNHSRSRVTSTLAGSGSLSHVTSHTGVTSAASIVSSGDRERGDHHHRGSGGGAYKAPSLLSDRLEVMSLGGLSNTADSESHAAGLAAPTPIKVVRLKADPYSMPRWTPRNTAGAGASNLKTALLSAVQGSNYTLVEQLLDRGVSPDSGVLHEAILQHDLESMRLLLVFGADPNKPDHEGVTPLLVAVEESFAEGATLLLKYGADPNRDGANPTKDVSESPLVAAFGQGKLGMAQLLMAYGGSPNHRVQRGGHSSDSDSGTDNSTTLLLTSIGRKKPRRLVDLLLAYGADPNAKDGHGTSPLFTAVKCGRADIVNALLDHGADVNLPGPKHVLWPSMSHHACIPILLARGADISKTPGILELACSLNKLETVRALIKAGLDVNSKKDGVYTPLCTAIRDNHVEIFNLLLENGADPNLPASEYPTWKCVTHDRVHLLPPLVKAGADVHKPPGIAEMAVQVGNAEALQWLLEHGGVRPDERNARGHTPLTTALRENRPEMVQLLLDAGADAGARGEDWPLVLAVRHPALLERLLPHVSNPRAVRGVLERAVAAKEIESVKLLLAAGVSVEDKTGGVFSPLTTAIREGLRPMVKFLLDEAGANPNSPGEHLPLVKAIRRGHQDEDGGAEIVSWLLAKGGDINKTYRGWNAAMQVLEDGNIDLLKLLVEEGGAIDLDVADDDGRTVAQMSESRGWPEGAEILLANSVQK